MNIKHLFFAILFIFFAKKNILIASYPTHKLVYNKDTFELFNNPFLQLENIDSLYSLFNNKITYINNINLSCIENYAGEWTIIDNQLYLTNIFSCYYNTDSLKASLQQFFGSKYQDKKIKADWVTRNLLTALGKLSTNINTTRESFYEKEVDFIFENGIFIGTKIYDNFKSKISTYSQPENLAKFIYSNINWDALPTFDEPIIVVIGFSANEAGIIDSTVIKKGRDTAFNNEAIRVIKSIPQWDILYKMGVHKRLTICYPIRFNAENRAKYKQ